jgi:hypothetical protein
MRFMRGIQFRTLFIQDRPDAVYTAQHVGKQMAFSVHKLDAFALPGQRILAMFLIF